MTTALIKEISEALTVMVENNEKEIERIKDKNGGEIALSVSVKIEDRANKQTLVKLKTAFAEKFQSEEEWIHDPNQMKMDL